MRVLAIALMTLLPAPALADALALSGRFGHWAVYVYEGQDGKVCYAATKPRTWGPAEAGERLSYMQVSTFQNHGVINEVSVTLGAEPDAALPAELRIGRNKDTHSLVVTGRRLHAPDANAEKRLIERMRKGRSLKIQARATNGRDLEYSYSLRGFDKAFQQLRKSCQ